MKSTKARIRANAKYDKVNTVRISFKFNVNTDHDILRKLESVDNKQGYIKELIRKDLASK